MKNSMLKTHEMLNPNNDNEKLLLHETAKEEREYKLKLREWERYEDERRRRKNKEEYRRDKQEKDWDRAITNENEVAESDEEQELWCRKILRQSRKSETRWQIRAREEHEDDMDRKLEEEEKYMIEVKHKTLNKACSSINPSSDQVHKTTLQSITPIVTMPI